MFYVAEGKVYGTEYDDKLKGYPEYTVTSDNQLVATGKSIAKKPKDRQVCELVEVLAQIPAKSETTSKAKTI